MNRQELQEALNLCKSSLSTQEFIPVLTHFCFTGESVYAYNDFQCIEVDFPSDLNCAIPGQFLTKLLDSYTSEDITMTMDDNVVVVKSGRSTVKIPVLDSDQFIYSLPDGAGDLATLKIDSRFLSGMSKCLLSVGDNAVRPEEMGITLDAGDTDYLFSTDNNTISRYDVKFNITQGELKDKVILPTAFCEDLLRITDQLGDEEVNLVIGKDYVFADINDSEVTIFTKLIDDLKIMDYRSLLKQLVKPEDMTKFQTVPEDLVLALDRSQLILSKEEDRMTKFELSGTNCSINSHSVYGDSDDEIELAKENVDCTFWVDPKYLSRAAKVCTKILFKEEVLLFQEGNFLHLVSHVHAPESE